MARQQFTGPTRFTDSDAAYAAAGGAAAGAWLYVRPSEAAVWLLTGADAPPTLNVYELTLSRMQMLQGALVVGGQPLVAAVETYIAGILTTGTPSQKIFWQHALEFRRGQTYVNQLRIGIQGGKTGAQSLAEMDDIFRAGSGYSPRTT
jgi:hypothetical protein